jgi:cyclic beta-1,2-glucan synthetase
MSYSPLVIISVILVAFFPALELSIIAVNRFFSFFLPPRVLPKMDYKENIPDASRTLVVIPTLLASSEDALLQIENMEIHAFANPDTDFNLLYFPTSGMRTARI